MFHVKHSATPNHAHRHHRAIRVVINMGRLYHLSFFLACDADIPAIFRVPYVACRVVCMTI